LLPIFVLAVGLAIDFWVYSDAKAHEERGRPVVFSAGALEVNTPTAWFLACLLMWLLSLPLYIWSRDQVGSSNRSDPPACGRVC
jgi:hypothetical protein